MKTLISAAAVLGLSGAALAGGTYGPGPGGDLVDAISTTEPGVFTSVISVGDSGGIIGDVSVDLSSMAHTWGGDLQISLTSPAGTMVDLVNRLGQVGGAGFGDSSNFNGDYSFANGGADLLTEAGNGPSAYDMASGVYAATTLENAAVDLGAFAGEDINGDWTLTISDFAGGDTGSLGGWTLNAAIPTPGAAGLLGLAGLAAVRRRR